MSKISIITPIYCDISQKLDWLDEMIQSVIPQTMIDWEIVLIDDKSPLSLDSIKMKYENEPRLRWFENVENNGPARTRNTAVGLAISNCILPLDSDDMLASSEVLEKMYNVWLADTTKIIYGDLNQYMRVDRSGKFQRGKSFQLGEYTFELARNLEGLMPVTSMHSKECHENTICNSNICLDNNGNPVYGWKSILEEGLEDLEYWIAAGKNGFCGQRIPIVTLLYRRQEESRAYKLKHGMNPKFRVMQNKIKQMHADIYAGRFPVACCGKQTSATVNDPVIMSGQVKDGSLTTSLSNSLGEPIDEKNWIWKQYQGARQGNFARISRITQIQYMIHGNNHTFPIHKKDEALFRGTVRDKFPTVPDPRTVKPEPEPEIQIETPTITEIPKPEMSTIVRLDSIAMGTVEADIQPMPPEFKPVPEVIIEPNPPSFISDTMSGGYPMPSPLQAPNPQVNLSLSNLGLAEKLTGLLDENKWTVELLAIAKEKELTVLSGIGTKRATIIIEKAKELINKT